MAIAELVRARWPDFSIHHVRMAYSQSADQVGRLQVGKLMHLVGLVAQTIRTLRRYPDALFFYPPAGPSMVPLARDVLYLSCVRPFARRTIFHFHAGGVSNFVSAKQWLKPLAMHGYGRADAAIQIGRSCPADGAFFLSRRVYLVPNGVDVPVLPASPGQKDPDEFRILFVGLHTESKGVMLIVEIAKLLRDRGVPISVRMVGEWASDKERSACLSRVADYGLQRRIVFTGRLDGDAKWREYANASVFLFPSTYPAEAMPLVLLEAMAYSLPIVATDWRGIPDVVANKTSGVLLPPNAVAAFAAALEGLWLDPSARCRMGHAARQRYEAQFTLERHLAGMHKVFRDVADLPLAGNGPSDL